ncbi:polysaccharide biosynthesis protein [Sorangium cellulosum]|uniref:Polysaccharide biosynthesis protein n=1 Tax=Sorangium cellulosum TaxID=56 RepID=A0A2L0F2H2_SORCE|nr:polysaccharide biosynthesis/export family protein [Sorangium cellulosum]AUX45746.1 polysaccharide biosynthesis protein [Sorangium cellulosum]
MQRSGRWLAALLALAISACSSRQPEPVNLPPPVEATTIGVGDVFDLRIVGEDKLPSSFTVAPDGTVDFPYVKRLKVAGLEPQELAELVRAKLMEGQILTDPSVSVSIREYNSKRVEVLGEVQKPGSLPLQPGMTLLRAISMAGGFNSIANKDRVTIRRKSQGKTVFAVVSVEDIIDNKIPDVPLQAGDSINVAQRVF